MTEPHPSVAAAATGGASEPVESSAAGNPSVKTPAAETPDTTIDAAPEEPTQESSEDANKRRFREALAHKNNRHGEDHLDGGGKVKDNPHGPVGAKRTFRRKSGG